MRKLSMRRFLMFALLIASMISMPIGGVSATPNATYVQPNPQLADQTTHIQSVINSVYAQGGGEVSLTGTFYTKSSIRLFSNITLSGDATIIKEDSNNFNVINVTDNSTNVVIRGLTLENRNSYASIGINISRYSSNITIEDNEFLGSQIQAVNVNALGIHNINILRNTFTGTAWGVLTNQNASDLKYVYIRNNTFTAIKHDAIELNHPNSGGNASWFEVTDNVIDGSGSTGSGSGSGFGIGIAQVHNVIVTGNHISNTRHQAMHIEDESAHILIKNNTIIGGNESGIYVIDGDDLTITRNVVESVYGYGIDLDYDPIHQAENSKVTYNQVRYNVKGGIRASGKTHPVVSNLSIHYNTVEYNLGDGITLLGDLPYLGSIYNTVQNNGGHGYFYTKIGKNWNLSNNTVLNNGLIP